MKLLAMLALGVVSLCAETPAELEKLLATTAEPGIVMVEIARQYAIAGDRKQALAWFEKAEVLDRGSPLFDVPTTGAVAGNTFYFVANSQLHNYGAKGIVDRAKLRPISILKLKL